MTLDKDLSTLSFQRPTLSFIDLFIVLLISFICLCSNIYSFLFLCYLWAAGSKQQLNLGPFQNLEGCRQRHILWVPEPGGMFMDGDWKGLQLQGSFCVYSQTEFGGPSRGTWTTAERDWSHFMDCFRNTAQTERSVCLTHRCDVRVCMTLPGILGIWYWSRNQS